MTPSQRAALAYKAVRSDLGRQAADEEWISELWDFVMKNGRDPDGAEITALRDLADVKWTELPNWPFACAREAVINKFNRLRRQAYGG